MVRFGTFELDLVAGELRKGGRKVRVQEQPFQLLAALVEKPGEVVTREDLKDKLWPGDTYVDFDRSLNTAASKLRDALRDSASSPRFVETLPRRGYRFLASVEVVQVAGTDGRPSFGRTAKSGSNETNPLAQDAGARRQLRLAWVVAAAAVCVAVALAVALLWPDGPGDPRVPLRRFTIELPESVSTSQFALAKSSIRNVAISPNGKHVAIAPAGENRQLWVHDLDQRNPRAIEGTEDARWPFWSPDSQFIGFAAAGELKKIAVSGGEASLVCSLMQGNEFLGGTWSPDGESIVFSSNTPSSLYEVPARGGAPAEIVSSAPFDEASAEPYGAVIYPQFLPLEDGSRLLLFTYGSWESPTMMVQDLDTGRREIIGKGTLPYHSPSGHILYQPTYISYELWALPFSLGTLQAKGEAFRVLSNGRFATVAMDGTLVYLDSSPSIQERLVWLDRNGDKQGEVGQPQESPRYPSLSPDQRQVAVSAIENASQDIWIWDLDRGVKSRLTDAGTDMTSFWSPTGEQVAFTAARAGNFDTFIREVDDPDKETAVGATPGKEFLCDWSRDGQYLIYETLGANRNNDLWYLQQAAADSWEAHPFIETRFDERAAQFSPDGRFVAYVSNESGQYEVYVQPFPEGGRKITVSNGGGVQPRWSRDGKELFFTQRGTLLSVPVSLDADVSVGLASPLFQHRKFEESFAARYDVSSDGRRFLLAEPGGEVRSSPIRVVQDWYEEFRDRPGEDK
jgi:Tol biopolymer transport system component/DNA-binding winged helix-turn-helix (wHTH) protein